MGYRFLLILLLLFLLVAKIVIIVSHGLLPRGINGVDPLPLPFLKLPLLNLGQHIGIAGCHLLLGELNDVDGLLEGALASRVEVLHEVLVLL